MKILFQSLVVIFILTACTADNKSAIHQNSTTSTVLVGKGDLYGNGQEGIPPQYSVITSENQWETLKNQMNSVNPVTDGFTETQFDFAESILIAVFDEVRENGGHSIDITDVDENSDIVHITVTKLLNGNMTAVMTQPYHIIRIPATDKEIIFN